MACFCGRLIVNIENIKKDFQTTVKTHTIPIKQSLNSLVTKRSMIKMQVGLFVLPTFVHQTTISIFIATTV